MTETVKLAVILIAGAVGGLLVGLLMWRRAPRRPPTPNPFPKVDWNSSQFAEEMDKVAAYSLGEAMRYADWYGQRRRSKKTGGWVFRGGAIVVAAVAGLIPVVADLMQRGGMSAPLAGWSTVGLALAGLMVAIDKFSGFTSAWIRFMLAELDLRQAADEFRFDWERSKASVAGAPQIADAPALLEKCKVFLLRCESIVRQETEKWAAEFQSALAQVEEARASAQVKQLGAIRIKITNGDQCTNGWNLFLDGASLRSGTGKDAAVTDVTPAIHRIRVVGDIGGATKQAEIPVPVPAGGIAEAEVTLA